MNFIQILFLAMVLDFVFGDPEKLWDRYTHPAVLMGRLVNWFDEHFNNGAARRIKGVIAMVALVIIAAAVGVLIKIIPDYGILELVMLAILLAHDSLTKHVKAVANGLRQGIGYAREEVAKIVGRDPEVLDESGVAAAAVESGAENFSDAVVSPIFWFLVFGLPGVLVFKIVNTADSMIGHKSERYLQFGWAAARLDDLMNWVPARITGGLMCLAFWSRDAFDTMLADAPLHNSPNAGWPEAAAAGLLEIRLAGPRVYEGAPTDTPYLNPRARAQITADDVDGIIAIINRSWLALAGLFGFFAALTWLF